MKSNSLWKCQAWSHKSYEKKIKELYKNNYLPLQYQNILKVSLENLVQNILQKNKTDKTDRRKRPRPTSTDRRKKKRNI